MKMEEASQVENLYKMGNIKYNFHLFHKNITFLPGMQRKSPESPKMGNLWE